jgi:hypothetical protein
LLDKNLNFILQSLQGGIDIHILGRFNDQSQIGGLVDTLKNSGIQRRDIIISDFDNVKFDSMTTDTDPARPVIMSDQDDPGELKAFVQGVKELEEDNGIVVFVKAARKKAQEVKSVMEQSGAIEIIEDVKKSH